MRRFYISAFIGDGGEMGVTAYPEDICDNEQPRNGDHTFGAWIESPFTDTGHAVVQGAKLANDYFNRLFIKEEAARNAATRNADLYREPSTAGEW